jgi:hypothetical protein
METVLILILLCFALDIAAWRWGFDSTEQIDSPEWEQRWIWPASHGKFHEKAR